MIGYEDIQNEWGDYLFHLQQSFYLFHYRIIGRQPLHAVQMLPVEPCCSLVFKKSQRTRYYATQIATHIEVKLG